METLSIEKFNENQLPELAGLKEKQLAVVKENPFLKITDTKTYDEARKRRTALRTARTEIEKQDKLIVQKINDFKNRVKTVSQSLIEITKPHEDSQQDEITYWEEAKERERQEKLRIEEERKNKIQQSIKDLINPFSDKIDRLKFDDIEAFEKEINENVLQLDTAQFEEFAMDFLKSSNLLQQKFQMKAEQLKADEHRRLEDIRLKAEREALEAERKKIEEQQRLEAEKLQAEKDRIAKEQAEAQAKIDAENKKIEAEKQRLQAEKDKKEAAERAAKEKKEQEKQAKEAAKRAEAMKPEKEKVVAFAESLQFTADDPSIENPEILKAKSAFIERVDDLKQKFINHINTL